jgi:hypothetical protein
VVKATLVLKAVSGATSIVTLAYVTISILYILFRCQEEQTILVLIGSNAGVLLPAVDLGVKTAFGMAIVTWVLCRKSFFERQAALENVMKRQAPKP